MRAKRSQPTKEEFRQQVVAHCSDCPAALRRSDWGWVVMVSKEVLCAACYQARFGSMDDK